MKKLLIILFLLSIQNVTAHEQHAHQLITLEAYNLLKLYLGADVTLMYEHLGSQIGYAGDGPWTTGLILSGAWREDLEDVVYHYCNANPPTVTRMDGSIANAVLFFLDLFNDNHEAYSSVTHFWEPDNGDALATTMEIEKLGKYYQFTVPNAYQKMLRYCEGNYSISVNPGFEAHTPNGEPIKVYGYELADVNLLYNNLINFFKTGIVFVDVVCIVNTQTNESRTYSGEIYLNDELKNNIAFEILGRMCHLLQDMTVPSHVHNDAHGNEDDGIREDPYETSFGPILWTGQEVNQNVGGIFDINNISDPIHYLMFINAQMSDHFAGAGPYSTRVDDLIEGDYSIQEYDYLTSKKIASWGEPCSFYYLQLTDNQLLNVRNKLIPQAIRSTATLLYWFAKEADILPIPLTGVSVYGTSTLYSEMTGHWYTEKENGLDPITYNWEIMYTDGGGFLESYEDVKKMKEKKEKKGDSDIIIRAAPSNEWVPVGLNQSYFQKPHNPYDLRDFYLRCTVTDGSNTTKISNSQFVEVVSYPPPQASVVNAGNSETAQMAEEISLNKQNQDAVTSASELPEGFSLEQNYPNPFNPATNITYSIPEGCFVTLKVYDMLGREAAALVNENKPAGRFTVTFNAAELPSGTYIYKLTAGAHTIVKKMSFVK